jgi:hypothetical protein
MKKALLMIVLSAIVSCSLLLLRNSAEQDEKTVEGLHKERTATDVRIAVCPTFYGYIENFDSKNYKAVLTSSTSESIKLLEKGMVDFALGGRILKPDEPIFENIILGDGYSFLSNEEILITYEDIQNSVVYTDQKPEDLKRYFSFDSIIEVDNVYEHLEKGIVITKWVNTDLLRAGMVHLYNSDGTRVRYSRIPILYYTKSMESSVVSFISERVSEYVR